MKSRSGVVLPAYNEADVIDDVIAGIREVCPAAQIIVVDDASTDDTSARATEAGASVVRHQYNMGNGAAVKTGIRHAKGDYVVLMDGDGQHDPADTPRLLEHFPEYDMVVGARSRRTQASWGRVIANGVYNTFATYVTGRRIEDLTSGFRAIKRTLARQFLYLLPNTFSYPTTITLACLRAGFSLKYVPISANKRVGRTKIRPWTDGTRFLLIILRVSTLFSPLKVFLPVSLLCLAVGGGFAIYRLLTDSFFSPSAQLLLVAGMIIFMLGLISEQVTALRYQDSEDVEWPG